MSALSHILSYTDTQTSVTTLAYERGNCKLDTCHFASSQLALARLHCDTVAGDLLTHYNSPKIPTLSGLCVFINSP